jgi:WD40 repeat protein
MCFNYNFTFHEFNHSFYRKYRWDTRSSSSDRAHLSIIAHDAEVNTVSFSPNCEFLLVTGSSDKVIFISFYISLSLFLTMLMSV